MSCYGWIAIAMNFTNDYSSATVYDLIGCDSKRRIKNKKKHFVMDPNGLKSKG